MGCASSQLPVNSNVHNDKNIHVVHSDIKVHTVVSAELDFDHKTAMHIPLVRSLPFLFYLLPQPINLTLIHILICTPTTISI